MIYFFSRSHCHPYKPLCALSLLLWSPPLSPLALQPTNTCRPLLPLSNVLFMLSSCSKVFVFFLWFYFITVAKTKGEYNHYGVNVSFLFFLQAAPYSLKSSMERCIFQSQNMHWDQALHSVVIANIGQMVLLQGRLSVMAQMHGR